MSTYYYLVCDPHAECLATATTAAGNHYTDSGDLIGPFTLAHRDCPLYVTSEHNEKIDSYTQWDRDNSAAMIEKHNAIDH